MNCYLSTYTENEHTAVTRASFKNQENDSGLWEYVTLQNIYARCGILRREDHTRHKLLKQDLPTTRGLSTVSFRRSFTSKYKFIDDTRYLKKLVHTAARKQRKYINTIKIRGKKTRRSGPNKRAVTTQFVCST